MGNSVKPRKPTRRTDKPNSQTPGLVRIIGGDWRGRKLPVMNQNGLRPTSDRVRETLFNWLQFELPGARCLDAFSGSGALGFEALSRGASQVVMIEKQGAVAKQLQANVDLLKAANAQIVNADSLSWLSQTAQQTFDIVFVDPPFGLGLVEPTLQGLFEGNWLNHQAWLYIEQEKALDWPSMPEGWVLHREKTTSQVRLGLWHKPEYDVSLSDS